jgi:hypothetical protein
MRLLEHNPVGMEVHLVDVYRHESLPFLGQAHARHSLTLATASAAKGRERGIGESGRTFSFPSAG